MVKVANKGVPVSGATVEVHFTPQKTITDQNGYARFANIERGKHTIYLSYDNYNGKKELDINGNNQEIAINFDIELKPKNTFLSPLAITIISLLTTVFLILLFKTKKSGK